MIAKVTIIKVDKLIIAAIAVAKIPLSSFQANQTPILVNITAETPRNPKDMSKTHISDFILLHISFYGKRHNTCVCTFNIRNSIYFKFDQFLYPDNRIIKKHIITILRQNFILIAP